jgi:hypothetical protein
MEKQITFHVVVVVVVVRQNASICEYSYVVDSACDVVEIDLV